MKKVLLATALVSLSTLASNAAVVVIDSFDTTNFQVVGAPSLGASPANPMTTSGPTSDAIGGVRTITVERTSPAGTSNAFGQQVQAVVAGGDASVSLGNSVEGTALFYYNAGGADLVDGTNDGISIDILTVDQSGILFGLNIDGVAVTQEATVGTISFSFADFGGADLTNVSSIGLFITGPASYDVNFDNIRASTLELTPVPLPASGLLILGGLGALGAMRARRKS